MWFLSSCTFFLFVIKQQHSPHSGAANGTNKFCPLPEPSQVHDGDHPVTYSKSDTKPHFPRAGKILSWNSIMARRLQIFTNRGSLELFVPKAKCTLASLHLYGEAVAAIILLRWTITPHYILILFPTRITSHFFSLVSLVYGSSISITFWQMTAKCMFDLTERDNSIDNAQNKVLL